MKSLNNFKETRVCFLNVYSKFIFISYCPFYCLLLPKFSVISTPCAACSQLLVFCTKLGKKINLLISNSCLKIHFECFILSVVFVIYLWQGIPFKVTFPKIYSKKLANQLKYFGSGWTSKVAIVAGYKIKKHESPRFISLAQLKHPKTIDRSLYCRFYPKFSKSLSMNNLQLSRKRKSHIKSTIWL